MSFTRRPRAWQPLRQLGLALSFVALLGSSHAVSAKEDRADVSLQQVALERLPAEAQSTYRSIRRGGPFPYEKDGSVFGNRERKLPRQARGFYREYTVVTPHSRTRGARRIVCGGLPPMEPKACYYTEDHYASFRRIVH